jgi:hypothetical protein
MPTTHIYRFIEGELLGKDRVSESDIYKMVWFIDQIHEVSCIKKLQFFHVINISSKFNLKTVKVDSV